MMLVPGSVGLRRAFNPLQLRFGEELPDAILADVVLERVAAVGDERLERQPLVLAVEKLRFALAHAPVDVVVVQTLDLRQRHVLGKPTGQQTVTLENHSDPVSTRRSEGSALEKK